MLKKKSSEKIKNVFNEWKVKLFLCSPKCSLEEKASSSHLQLLPTSSKCTAIRNTKLRAPQIYWLSPDCSKYYLSPQMQVFILPFPSDTWVLLNKCPGSLLIWGLMLYLHVQVSRSRKSEWQVRAFLQRAEFMMHTHEAGSLTARHPLQSKYSFVFHTAQWFSCICKIRTKSKPSFET